MTDQKPVISDAEISAFIETLTIKVQGPTPVALAFAESINASLSAFLAARVPGLSWEAVEADEVGGDIEAARERATGWDECRSIVLKGRGG